MNLILQSLTPETATIERIAAMARAQRITALSASAVRCEHIIVTPQERHLIEAACFTAQLDCTFVSAARKLSDFKLLAMDMDSTLITIECIDEIADMQGLKPQVAAITEAAMRGEIEFDESLTRRVGLLKGLEATALQRVYDERLQLSPGAELMLTAIKEAGLKTLLVSGGFTFFTDRIRQRLGLDFAHSNQLEIIDGKLTGRVLGAIVNAAEKKYRVEHYCAQLGCAPAQAIVMGDGANDLQMMGIAGMSVAFRAKPIVREKATVALNFVGLDGILPLFEPS